VKSEETRRRILEAALDLFREKGFAETTMREIAAAAGVATGAAYYYFASKEAIVLAFYELASEEMAPLVEQALAREVRLDRRLAALIEVKLGYFEPNRKFLGALLGRTIDRQHPLSPFSAETRHIRDRDLESFRNVIGGGDISPPNDIAPRLPEMLWAYQMSVVFFWLTDTSPGQARTRTLTVKSAAMIAQLLRLSKLPLMRPLRRQVLDLVELVAGDQNTSFSAS
jgi:AcrR family transcriptional regulator